MAFKKGGAKREIRTAEEGADSTKEANFLPHVLSSKQMDPVEDV